MRKLPAVLLLIALLCFAFALAEQGETRILVIETTDIHGYIMDASSGNPDTFQYRLAYIAGRVSEARASGEYDDVLLLDGGDLYQGTPVSNMTGGAAVRAALDVMQYDAVALGNHEFDWEVTEYAADKDATVAPYVLGDFFGDPKIPVLAPGLYDAATGERVPFTRDYVMVEKAGKRIAVVGYIPDYRGSIMSEKIAPYTIERNIFRLKDLVAEVNETEHPDATVVLGHQKPAEFLYTLDPAQVTLVAGGHSHENWCGVANNGIPYIQGNVNGTGFASAVLVFSADGSVRVEDPVYTGITDSKALLYNTPENAAHLDPEIMEISHAAWDAIREEMEEVLGYIDTPVDKPKVTCPCSAGNWITGLMLRYAREYGAVAAFYNWGGIRARLEIPKNQSTRNVTVYDVYSITPFGNSILIYEVTGAELAQHLVNSLKNPNFGDQVSGLTYTYTATGDADTPADEREYEILSVILDDGTAVDLLDTQTVYRICTSNFNATVRGSVFEGKEPVLPESEAPVDFELFIRLLREEGQQNNGYIYVDDSPHAVRIPLPGQEIPAA